MTENVLILGIYQHSHSAVSRIEVVNGLTQRATLQTRKREFQNLHAHGASCTPREELADQPQH